MNKIKTIIICLIVILSTCAICTELVLLNEQTTTLKLSETCSINITGEYNTVFENGMNQIKIFDKFNNKEYKSMIVYCNSANKELQEIMAFGTFKSFFVGNTYDTGAEPIKTEWNGDTVYVIYTSNNTTHDNILIISKNRDDCIKMYNSIKYNNNTANNTTVNNTTVTNTTVEKISSNNDNHQQKNIIQEKQDTLRESDAYMGYVQQAKNSRDKNGQMRGMSDEQIEESVYNEMMYGRG